MSKEDATEKEKRLKQIVRQITGNVKNIEGELIPEVAIRGQGIIFCYCPVKKRMIPITRGLKAYIIEEEVNAAGNVLIYTFMGHIVEIDPEDLIHTGCD